MIRNVGWVLLGLQFVVLAAQILIAQTQEWKLRLLGMNWGLCIGIIVTAAINLIEVMSK